MLQSEQAVYKGKRVRLKLTPTVLFYESIPENKLLGNTSLDCVIGAAHLVNGIRVDTPSNSKDSLDATTSPTYSSNSEHQLVIYRYVFSKSSIGCFKPSKYRKPDHLYFKFTDQNLCDSWANTINHGANHPYFGKSESNGVAKRRKFLVVINPRAGQSKTLQAWQKTVKTFLLEANIDYKVFVTEGANHAYLYVLSFEWVNYAGIITLGGDGTLAEVVNGLCNRDDGARALSRLVLIPLGGGTGNGLIKSVLYSSHQEYSMVNALFCAVKGQPQAFDLSFVQTQSKRHHAFLLLGWGLVADIDILSESLRWMGELRLHVAAVYFILGRRTYRGRISFLPVTAVSAPPNVLPPLGAPLPLEWEVVEADFATVMILQTSHCSTSMHSAPGALLDDGVFTIQIVRAISRFQLLQLLLSFDSGDHVKNPLVKVCKAYAYRLEPLTSEGRFTLDGELVEYGPIQGVIMKTKATTFRLDDSGFDV